MQSLWMLVASFFFACMGVCVKYASRTYAPAEIVFYRSALSVAMLLYILHLRRVSVLTPHWRFQFWRSLSGFVSLLMYFYAISLLPLATAVTLSYTSPLFLVLYLRWLGKTPLRAGTLFAMLLGFVGVAWLLQPTLYADQWWPGLIGLGSGLIAGLAYYNVQELGKRGEPEERTVFYFSLVSAIGSAVWVAGTGFRPVDLAGGAMLLGVALFGTLAQLAMTRAYKRGKTLVSASLAYSTVIFASLFGMLFWQETLSPDAWGAIALIIASGVVSTWFSRASPAGQD